MNRRNRTWCALLLFITVGAHIKNTEPSPLSWGLLVLQFLVYPQLVYLRARHAASPRDAEMNNLALDALCFGIWAAALGFPVWITFVFLVTVTVNLTVFRGKRGFIQAIGTTAAGALIGAALFGLRLHPETGWIATLLSILTVSLYVLVVADNAYAHALKLHEMRAELHRSEQALKRQLEEITALQVQLREQANRDPLTGLHNRRYFDETLERELARCVREQGPLSVILIDVDHFKQINDSQGHQAGDEVLKALGALLLDQTRASDVACRYGGEEFVVLLPGTDQATARTRAEQWRAAFAEQPAWFADVAVPATLSAGVAGFPAHGTSAEALLRCADLALYRAKTEGRNRVMLFTASADLGL